MAETSSIPSPAKTAGEATGIRPSRLAAWQDAPGGIIRYLLFCSLLAMYFGDWRYIYETEGWPGLARLLAAPVAAAVGVFVVMAGIYRLWSRRKQPLEDYYWRRQRTPPHSDPSSN